MTDFNAKSVGDMCNVPNIVAEMPNPGKTQLCNELGTVSQGYIPQLAMENYYVASQPSSTLQCDNMEYQPGFVMQNGHLDECQSNIGTYGIDSNLGMASMDGDNRFNTDLLNSGWLDNQFSVPSQSVTSYSLLNDISTTSAPTWHSLISSPAFSQMHQHQTCTTDPAVLHPNQAFAPMMNSQPNISASRQAYRQQASGPKRQVGTAGVDHTLIANYYDLNFGGFGNNVPRRILVDHDKPRRISARKPDETPVNQTATSQDRSARSLATIENGLQAAYRCGILDAHNRIVSNLLRELDVKRTLVGLNVEMCDGKVTDTTAKNIRTLLAVYCGHSVKNMSSHIRLKELLHSMQNDLFGTKKAVDCASVTKKQHASQVNASKEGASSHQMSHDVHGTRFDSCSPVSSAKSSHGGKTKYKDFKVNDKHTVYHYKGAESISYNCSDGIRRILTEAQLAEAQERTMQTDTGASNDTTAVDPTATTTKPAQRALKTEPHEVNLGAGRKRKAEPARGRASGPKKTRTRQTKNTCSLDPTPEASQVLHVQPWELQKTPAPFVESTSYASLIHTDDKLSQYIRGLANTTKTTDPDVGADNGSVDDILHSTEGRSNCHESNKTAEAVDILSRENEADHESDDLARCKISHNDGSQQITEQTATMTGAHGFQEQEINAADVMSQRLKELIRLDNSMPYSLIHDFMKPTASSIYTAVRKAAQRNDLSDQSGLLYDFNQRATAKDEYDSHCRQMFKMDEADQPGGLATVGEAERRTGSKKKTKRMQSNKKTKDKQEPLRVEQITQEPENKQLADILTRAAKGGETDLSSDVGRSEDVGCSAAESIKDEITEPSGSYVEKSDRESCDRETRVIDFEEQLLQSSWHQRGGI